jgi:PAS domain S-box-containing protein
MILDHNSVLRGAAEASAKFRTFFEQGSHFAGVMTLDGTLIEANRLSLEACGYTRDEVIGKKFWDCGWWNRSPELQAMVQEATQVAASGAIFRRESQYFVADGSIRYVDLILSPIKDDSGQVIFIAPTGVDITERLQSEQATARLAAIVESSDDAIISKDLNGIITSWNAAAARLFGYTAEEAIGSSVTMLMPTERLNEEPGILERIRRGQPIEHYETVRRRKDGTLLDISLSVSPLMDKYGKVVGASKIARDISDRKRIERALVEADRQKNEFIATLAHELRNPLAPIRNSLNILKLSQGDATAVSQLHEMMERQVNHMVHLVDDLLEISRITTGKIDLRMEQVDLATVIRSAVETSRPLIDSRQHRLNISLPPEKLIVDGDAVRLSQIVANLLNNAAKYTEPEGHIWLSVSRDGAEALISVRDNGLGISAEQLPHVLEMFNQADRAKRHSQDGLGIGLALVKRLVEMHGGCVETYSDGEGKGSEFTLRLPLSAQMKSASAAATSGATESQSAGRRRILVVDDNRDAAVTLSMLLKLLGNEVATAHDGHTGLQAFDEFLPSLVLLDLGMPDMTGFDVARELHTRPHFAGVTLVALTGWGQADDRRRTAEAGFDYHLVKPVTLDALNGILAQVPIPAGAGS